MGPEDRWSRANLLPLTVFATFWLMLLGIYTAAIGAGLTCDGRWPLCDGAVFGLFPANWTSFVEWFHRLVAMITGFFILGSWWVVWRSDRSRIARLAMTVAVVLLPVQVWLGAETVWQYEILYLTAHFLTALIIFGALIAGTWWWMGRRLDRNRRGQLLAGVLALFVPFVLLTPHFLVIHSGRIQMAYYGIGLLMFAGLLILTIDGVSGSGPHPPTTAILEGAALLTLVVQLLAGRLLRSSVIHTVDWVAAAALFVLLVAAVLFTRPPSFLRSKNLAS